MDSNPKTPDPLPPSVSFKPVTSPTPAAPEVAGPSLNSRPASPAAGETQVPTKVTSARAPAHDEVPPAPVFLPAAR
jgi:hypothetical protein